VNVNWRGAILYFLILLVASALIFGLFPTQRHLQEVPLSQVVTDVDDGLVKSIKVKDSDLEITYEDGKTVASRKEAGVDLTKTLLGLGVNPVALDDVDESNGCMSMVPGSHLWGREIDFLHTLKDFKDMPAEYKGHKIEVRLCPVPKGYVHYHHPLTWHGSHANHSGRPRRAIAFHYMTQDTVYVESGNHIMKPYITVDDGEMLQGEVFPRVWPQ